MNGRNTQDEARLIRLSFSRQEGLAGWLMRYKRAFNQARGGFCNAKQCCSCFTSLHNVVFTLGYLVF